MIQRGMVMKSNIRKIFSIEALMVMANYPAFFLYTQNANEVSFLSAVNPSVVLTFFLRHNIFNQHLFNKRFFSCIFICICTNYFG